MDPDFTYATNPTEDGFTLPGGPLIEGGPSVDALRFERVRGVKYYHYEAKVDLSGGAKLRSDAVVKAKV